MSQHTNTANATIGQFKESIGKVIGEAQKAFGGLKGDDEMIARGHGNVAKDSHTRLLNLKPKSTNMTDRLTNAANQYIGSAKQTLGNTIGNESLAASGAEQRARGEAAQKAAEAKTHAEGLQNKAKGEVQQKVGELTNDTSMQAKGAGNAALGDVQRSV
ncbi:hypothetical protein BGW41_000239 [Actinomortierella wolfii]|nr:hypothetical protein BGW41_000239 [Actinomortierella wolfii]